MDRSDWGARPLSEDQVTYAALDAIVLVRIANNLFPAQLLYPPRANADTGNVAESEGDLALSPLQVLAKWRETCASTKP
jgi:hypothetical protein